MRSQKECIELLRGYFQNKAKDYGIVRMALFGSVVRNEQTEESDVDIAYEGEANLLLRSRMISFVFANNLLIVYLDKMSKMI